MPLKKVKNNMIKICCSPKPINCSYQFLKNDSPILKNINKIKIGPYSKSIDINA